MNTGRNTNDGLPFEHPLARAPLSATIGALQPISRDGCVTVRDHTCTALTGCGQLVDCSGNRGADMDEQSRLLTLLATHAYQYQPESPFTLASGRVSPEYLDCKLALSQPEAVFCLGKLLLARLKPQVVAIGGLTMGSDPIAVSTSIASFGTDRQVRWFAVRKEPKIHGRKKLIEGDVREGETIAVVDDVVTSGSSTIQAIMKCREAGFKVAQVIVLVDREQDGGLDEIRKVVGEDVPVDAIFKKSQIHERWLDKIKSTRPILEKTA